MLALAGVLVVIAVTAGICVLYFVSPTVLRSDWQKPAEQHMASHLLDLQRDRDALLQLFRGNKLVTKVMPEGLPASIRVPGLKFALVHRDHVTLVLYHSPDTDSGYRVWTSTMPGGYADQATSISFVTRFTYCDDYPDSPSNKLE